MIRVYNNSTKLPEIINGIVEQGKEDNFYICNISDVIQKYYLWQTCMPNITPFYAVKCNDHEDILKVLASLGTGFDCASKAEINKVLSLNVDPSRIIFAHPNKPTSHIRHAVNTGVKTMTFDSDTELYKIKSLYPEAETIIRIKSATKKAVIQLDLKFGCYADTEAAHLLTLAKKLNIKVIGLSFHIGFGCQDPEAFKNTIALARNVFDAAADLGFQFKILDLGGGYPRNNGQFIKLAKQINVALKNHFSDLPIKIVAEPGQFFVATSFTLACNIVSVKNQDNYLKQSYYLSEGVYGGFRGPYDLGIPLTLYPLKKCSYSKTYPTTMYGPTCSSTDILQENVMLPKMCTGDWLVFKNMGAYTLGTSSSFNGFFYGKIVNVISRDDWFDLRNKWPFNEEHFVFEETICIDDELNSDEKDSVTFYLSNKNIKKN